MNYIGMDIHKKYSSVAVMDERGSLVDACRMNHLYREELIKYFKQFPSGTQVAMEATCGWSWLSELLQDLDLEVKLAHPSKVRVIAESQVKTDKVDARVLAQLLRTNFLPEAYLAPREQREARDLLRYRMSLVHLRTGVKNRIHALLIRLGIHHSYSDLFGKQGLGFLSSLQLSSVHRKTLDGYLSVLDTTASLIKEAEVDIRQVIKESEEGQHLLTVPGIGFILAYLILVEIGDINRFPSSKKLCSYAGLVPSVHQSSSRNYHGHIVKGANRYLCWGMIEAAQKAKVIDPYLRDKAQKIEKKKGGGVATVAIARQLMAIIYHLLKEKRDYYREELKIAGSGRPVRLLVVPRTDR
ncbi:MAG: IS110 family transposase [bacterium]